MRNLLISISAFLIFCVFGNPQAAHGQFIHFQMSVEPELRTSVIQNIDFGEFVNNSGLQQIEKGSPGMGIFEIRGLQNQNVAVTLDPPEAFVHSNFDINAKIPVSLQASFTSGNIQDIEEAEPFTGNNAWFSIGDHNNPSLKNHSWVSAFIYIYGSLDIGDVPEGTYEAMLVLTVEYQ